MFLTGYHATSSENADIIISSGEYSMSDGRSEWLGKGIYFYPDINDAYEWRDCDAILHSVIGVEPDEYLDIDSDEGRRIYNNMAEMLLRISNLDESGIRLADPQRNQCALMNLLWNSYDKLKVISGSFAKEPTKLKTLMDFRPRRKEFCVKDNSIILVTYKISKEALK